MCCGGVCSEQVLEQGEVVKSTSEQVQQLETSLALSQTGTLH